MVEITKNSDFWTIFKELRKIDSDLKAEYDNDADCIDKCNVNNLSKIVFITAKGNYVPVYDLTKKKWLNNGLKFLNLHQEFLLNDFIGQIEAVRNSDHELIIPINESNPFKDYTNHLAEILQEKNDAYGDAFTKSVDEDGLLVLKIRLGDKLNRVSSLIKRGELKENDESLEDTLLDLAGYSILGLKYLKEHKNEGN
ncbi:nucleotide modification associated domain-containing protein [Lactobacillus crispatus]|jgi:hypothetical protein|uniref:nucleotide modification associated domain-containing protein n=1 Tax=Lactobacillus crispatus TaxID=47770 RepID=UPI00107633D5|nr:nucleotide modification associated domain-containing protein [Lactobacillus crispatus]